MNIKLREEKLVGCPERAVLTTVRCVGVREVTAHVGNISAEILRARLSRWWLQVHELHRRAVDLPSSHY